jgi:ubiquinone/menaquinone biosynthesis C-methylase UbiE/UDP-N-acetylglucosamine transferase subunit ALG13
MAQILVTVGMSPWPFDRLIGAIQPLCSEHEVFAQIGTSAVRPPCPHAAVVGYEEMRARIAAADIVITHAGNTVRLVQRAGKVPIAVAREASRGEMSNDHQVEYLREEELTGRVVALWGDLAGLPEAVRRQPEQQARLMAERELPPLPDGQEVAALLDAICERLLGTRTVSNRAADPFRTHPIRRYSFAWNALAGRSGRHLDLGCGSGKFLIALQGTSRLECFGADAHLGYLEQLRRRAPEIPLRHVRDHESLPFPDGYFSSLSLLDVLEHVANEDEVLRETHRVLEPGGLLVVSVPARHAFSFLDPDNAKFRFPRLHRWFYISRFDRERYERRFVDLSDGLRGDLSVERDLHQNYSASTLIDLLHRNGFAIERRDGANLFWRWMQLLGFLAGPRSREVLDKAMYLDGAWFHSANMFLVARRKT